MIRPTARYVLPEFHERTSSGFRTMDPYSKLLSERVIFLGTQIDDTAANDVIAQLMYLEHNDPDQDISLYINSPGGSLTAMTSIYDTMRFVACDTETVCLGQAASAAAVLLAAGTPGKRLALPGSRMLIHQPALLEPIQGQASDLEVQAREVERSRRLLEELLARHTGRSTEQISQAVERETFLTAEQAVEFGLVDLVTRSRKGLTTHPLG
ncbi:ATP-dependent Clp protease proteolytic subunit [Wenjunlia vitaminophila]|uniref:ATP-dependent Clp protease proteolytic subunit n=1 Tax=Wenjunlia vitaminophila TaxID=76728 RepID=A0A0T6LUV9_WENVI|nr:ATP-dependent Clp protease proteolytic subunit [Wenjunlia vitaminophila]KRV49784.1 ATP-dependent Clp protease proteolytic subunit [Wenjunlia vitaminophila]